ncbi:hypothetical protein CIPAW_06G000800 [Carya illinoinensis]|uniref:Cyanobacterial aminoacyl-tRNA synthetase CAAD domain-containing protein n=1 Tax=Carya illinoinensis TaxID=32201 RepID=A0A8T1PZS7_CARIL|nr:hypothetical protein CIPAW_06G000800 [Carya illinoinensis]
MLLNMKWVFISDELMGMHGMGQQCTNAYYSGALVALWFASTIVGAIDSIPLFTKLMEVVGLGYTL